MQHLEADVVAPGLLVGSMPRFGPTIRRCGVDVLVLCAEEFQPRSVNFPGVSVIHAPFDDGPMDSKTGDIALKAATRVADLLARGKTVLVTCIEGRNRSALVAALALTLVTGMSGGHCAEQVRARRHPPRGGMALSNSDFYEALCRL